MINIYRIHLVMGLLAHKEVVTPEDVSGYMEHLAWEFPTMFLINLEWCAGSQPMNPVILDNKGYNILEINEEGYSLKDRDAFNEMLNNCTFFVQDLTDYAVSYLRTKGKTVDY